MPEAHHTGENVRAAQSASANIAARKAAEEVADLIEGMPSVDTDTGRIRFIGCLAKLILPDGWAAQPMRIVAESEPEPYERLAQEKLAFWKHDGMAFRNISLDYLAWLADESRGLVSRLDAYLRHPSLSSARPQECEEWKVGQALVQAYGSTN